MSEPEESRNPETVSRLAFFGGLSVGALIAAVGFHLASPRGPATVPIELVTMALAMFVTTRIWRLSAAGSGSTLDSPRDRQDRGA